MTVNTKFNNHCEERGISEVIIFNNTTYSVKTIKTSNGMINLPKLLSDLIIFENKINSALKNKTSGYSLVYKNFRVFSDNLTNNRKLIVVSSASTDHKSISVFIEQLILSINNSSGKTTNAKSTLNNQTALHYNEEMDLLKKAVARIMGPVGDVIFENAKNQLNTSVEDGVYKISDLITILKKDIEEEKLVNNFEKILRKYKIAA